MKVSLKTVHFDTDSGIFKGRLKIAVRDTSHLDSLIGRLSAIKGVHQVNRVEKYGST